MKWLSGIGRHILWVALVIGLVGLFEGAGNLPSSHAMAGMTVHPGSGIQSKTGMPASCPSSRDLPCCHGKTQIALCQASLCDLCFFSSTLREGVHVSQAIRVHVPAFRIVADIAPPPSVFLQNIRLHNDPFPQISSFTPPINQPLLI